VYYYNASVIPWEAFQIPSAVHYVLLTSINVMTTGKGEHGLIASYMTEPSGNVHADSVK